MARSTPVPHAHPTDRIVGDAPAIQALRDQIRYLAAFDTVGSAFVPTLLLHGETGTGKGLVARVIHDSGPRAQGPFVEVNCAAIPETLLEVELFGFEAGTFTDAKRAKPGLVESALHGTLFLDEIEALPLLLQAKLLSVIDDKRVRRLGAVASRQLDVKFIAATPTDLSRGVTEGRFRPDLYHRLTVLLLEIPPLRQRGEDILVLAQHFLRHYAEGHGLLPKRLSHDAEAWLQSYGWSGNVRELSHLMERVTLLSREAVVIAPTLEQLCLPRPFLPGRSQESPGRGKAEPVDEAARMRQALSQTEGNVLRAAGLLGISRGTLRYWMRRYGISRPRGKAGTPLHDSRAQAADGSSEAERGVPTGVEHLGLEAAWEQKPVVVLAIDVTWPEARERTAPCVEPWTLVRRWQQTVAEKVQGFGGRIVQSSPAPLTAVFGLPQTLEQMPQRAVQAALAIRHQLAEARTADGRQAGPEVRLGVHLGQVLVDVQASDPTVHLLPLGETLSLPVRLLGHAAPGDILLSPQVGRLVEGWFILHPRQGPWGADSVDGVGTYAVVGVGSRGAPLAVYGTRPLSRFVGRERELGTLGDLLALAAQGRGQVVGIVGEPGVGKSRLCYELTHGPHPPGWLRLASYPTAYNQGIPYLPIRDLLMAYFQVEMRDTLQAVHDKVLGTLGALDAGLLVFLPALLVLLDVPVDDPSWLALEPLQRRQRMREACVRLLLRASQEQPGLLLVENLHWIDTETQAVLDLLVDRLLSARLLLLVTYRPDYQHVWGSKTSYTQLRLDPLAPAHAEALLHELLGEHPTLALLTQRLITHTAGNPFFLEESVRTLVETGVLAGGHGAYQLAQALPTLPVPVTVQTVLAARIDRLPPAEKQLLHMAAVIGMEVPVPLLQAIAEVPEADVQASLRHLQATEFVYETPHFPVSVYTFKHALTHDVAYGRLLPERRQLLHARIVEVLETLAGDRLSDDVDRLAHHAIRGEIWDKTLQYCRQAGEKAMARSAYREAVGSLEQALDAAQHLPAQRDTLTQTLAIAVALRNALLMVREFRRGFAVLRQAVTVAKDLGEPQQLGEVYRTMIHACWRMGAHDEALAYGQRALTLAEDAGDVFAQAVTYGFLGTVYHWLGDYRGARDVLRRAIASLQGELLYKSSRTTIVDAVRARAHLVDCLAELGEFVEGVACGAEAVRIAREATNPSGEFFSQSKLGLLALRQGDLERALAVLAPAYAHCRAADMPLHLVHITIHLGLAYALSGRVPEALPLLDQVMRHEEASGVDSAEMLNLGEASLLAGRPEIASPLAERALELSRDRKERGYQAWALRLLGEIALHGHPPDLAQAEDSYCQALTLAEILGMRPLQAHCHAGLGILYAQSGQREQAHTALAAAIALYRDMDMTFWLPQTEATLAQVL